MTHIIDILRLGQHEYDLLRRAVEETEDYLSHVQDGTLAIRGIKASRLALLAAWLQSTRPATTKQFRYLSKNDIRHIETAAGLYISLLEIRRDKAHSEKEHEEVCSDIFRLRMIEQWLEGYSPPH